MSKSVSKSKSNPVSAAIPTREIPPDNNAVDTGSMDKIRDILFGNQVRDFERRFTRLENQITATIQELREEVRKQLDALEFFLKEEMAALKERQKTDNEQRQQDLEKLAQELKNTANSLNKTLSQNSDLFSERTSDLRKQILEQSKQLTADIKTKYEQAANELSQVAGNLDEAKMDRSTLAQYLIQMAMGLSGQTDGSHTQHTDQ